MVMERWHFILRKVLPRPDSKLLLHAVPVFVGRVHTSPCTRGVADAHGVLAIVISASCAFIGTGRVEQTGLWALLTPPASSNARIRSRLAARKNSKRLPCQFLWGSREGDAPARAGILASFEPEGEAFVTFVTPVEKMMGAAD